ncbi:hypothetical protein NDU88_005841 [Pleurodeles waltl]|uniref:Uncharacterized protein n=1 Tax=Pleurodeles waltl TaxID=8319 RepID=A0AAV7RJT9_PLEWA|nr:hypothetical protein NDU88_005841 [Pleurodeles waltl]
MLLGRRSQPTWPIGCELRLISPRPDAVRRWGGVDWPPPTREPDANPRERQNPARLPVERGATPGGASRAGTGAHGEARPCGSALDKREPAGDGEGPLPRDGGPTARDLGLGGRAALLTPDPRMSGGGPR